MSLKGKIFTQKTFSAELYKWAPSSNTKNASMKSSKPYFCNALASSQGEDWITTYSYNIFVLANGQQQRLAYVACDYVE